MRAKEGQRVQNGRGKEGQRYRVKERVREGSGGSSRNWWARLSFERGGMCIALALE